MHEKRKKWSCLSWLSWLSCLKLPRYRTCLSVSLLLKVTVRSHIIWGRLEQMVHHQLLAAGFWVINDGVVVLDTTSDLDGIQSDVERI